MSQAWSDLGARQLAGFSLGFSLEDLVQPARIFHAWITYISVSNVYSGTRGDPLEPQRLEHRLWLMKAISALSVRAQTRQDFAWFLIVDAGLPASYRAKWQAIVSSRPNSHIVTYQPGKFEPLEWLHEAIEAQGGADYVPTTALDDDDAVRDRHCAYLRAHVDDLHRRGALPELQFIGCENPVQSDFRRAAGAPLGMCKPWIRRDYLGQDYPINAGFTLCSKYPELSLSVCAFKHSDVVNACRPNHPKLSSKPALLSRLQALRNLISSAAQASTLDWDGSLSLERNYHAVSLAMPQAVVVNHGDNIQQARLDEHLDWARPVTLPSTFAGITVDAEFTAAFLAQLPPLART
jgi:hypothetical protein